MITKIYGKQVRVEIIDKVQIIEVHEPTMLEATILHEKKACIER